MAAESVTPFHGDKDDENPEDFLRSFYRRMGDKTDDTKKAQFPYYLQADSVADEWYSDLGDNEKKHGSASKRPSKKVAKEKAS